jgi:hypothetical protein
MSGGRWFNKRRRRRKMAKNKNINVRRELHCCERACDSVPLKKSSKTA